MIPAATYRLIACCPVYRTCVNACEPVSDRDRACIEHAVRDAKRRNPRTPPLVFDVVRDLLLRKADDIPDAERDEHIRNRAARASHRLPGRGSRRSRAGRRPTAAAGR